MEIACLQENLKAGLARVGRVVGKSHSLPILDHVLLHTEEGRLCLTATDLELTLSCYVGAQVTQEGTIALPAKLLRDVVSALPKERIDLQGDTKQAMLRCGERTVTVNGQDAQDFPPVPKVEGPSLDVAAADLIQAVGDVAYCASGNTDRPVLCGVLLEAVPGKLTLTAADGFRLGTVPIPAQGGAEREVIVPARALAETLHGCNSDDTVRFTFGAGSQVRVGLKNTEAVIQVIAGTFPNYRLLIPEAYTTRLTLPVVDLLAEVRAASLFAREGSGIIRLQWKPDSEQQTLAVMARAEGIGEHVGQVPANGEGEPNKIAVNGAYLIDLLSRLKTGTVTLSITNPSSPGLFEVPGREFQFVVMPMFVQWES